MRMNDQYNYKKLIRENKAKANNLTGEYKFFYKDIKNYITAETQPGIELQNAISDILDILLEGIQNNRNLNDLFPDGKNNFIEDFVTALPRNTPIVKMQRQRKKRIYFCILAAFIAIIIVLCALWQIGYIGIWFEGLAYHADELTKYTYHSTIISDEYTMELDLDHLDSNIGKIIYQDNNCSIDVYEVQSHPEGYFIVWFRSHGTYNLKTATLVSGVKHYSTEQRWFTGNETAKLTTEYNGKAYLCNEAGMSGLNYKDGDMFGFALVSSADPIHGTNGIFNPKGIVKVTITNLCVNIWNRK